MGEAQAGEMEGGEPEAGELDAVSAGVGAGGGRGLVLPGLAGPGEVAGDEFAEDKGDGQDEEDVPQDLRGPAGHADAEREAVTARRCGWAAADGLDVGGWAGCDAGCWRWDGGDDGGYLRQGG